MHDRDEDRTPRPSPEPPAEDRTPRASRGKAFAHALRVLEFDRIREILAAYALSGLGKQEAMAASPLRSPEAARSHLAQTEEMRALLKKARLPLAGVRDVVAELEAETYQGRSAAAELLYRAVDLLRSGRSVRSLVESYASALPRLSALVDRLEDLPELREEIEVKVDPRDGVRDTATDKLSVLRRRIEELRSSLRSRAARILMESRLRPAFQSEGVTIKNDRYLLPVKAEYRSWVPGPIRDRSHSGSTVYIEPEGISLEGDELVDALDAERNEVETILWDLTRKVLGARETLRTVQKTLGWIDFTHAKARFAEAFGLVSPTIDTEGVLNLREARHPYLLWLARDTSKDPLDIDLEAVRARVVPVDVRLGETFRVLVVTGPNTGGKTVVLKTVGLNVLMALGGIPIAAAPESRVAWFRNVFADIGDEQSIEQSLSTFSSHLSQVIHVLREADEGSLILLDEVGSGTDPLEGAALGRALLDRFLARGWKAIITTHIGSLKELAYEREGVENAAMEFDGKTLRPTYRLFLGIPGSSNALAIARRMGLEEEIVDAAEAEIAKVEAPTRELIGLMEQSRRRAEKERRRAERVRRRAQGDARVYRERLEEVESRRAAADSEAQMIVDDAVRKARETLTPLVEHLKNVPKTHRPLVDTLAEEVDRLLVSTPLGERREAYARSLKKDDWVFIPKFRERAKVRKIDKGHRKLTVLLNGIPMEVGFDDISWIDAPAGDSPTP